MTVFASSPAGTYLKTMLAMQFDCFDRWIKRAVYGSLVVQQSVDSYINCALRKSLVVWESIWVDPELNNYHGERTWSFRWSYIIASTILW
jgi:hypothetical protein